MTCTMSISIIYRIRRKGEDMSYESEDKMVNHPDHYQSENGLEVIDVIEAFTEELTGIEAVDTGKIIKYGCRWYKKNGIQDLEKVLWYTTHLIETLKKKAEKQGKTLDEYCDERWGKKKERGLREKVAAIDEHIGYELGEM